MIMLILLFNILMASTFTFSKAALWYVSPLCLITIRFLISGGCFLFYLWQKERKALYVPIEDWHLFFTIMLIPFYGAFALDNWSLQFISSSKSCLIYNLMPLMSAIIAYIGFKKKITAFQWITLFFGFASLLPILEGKVENAFPEAVFKLSYVLEVVIGLCGISIGWYFLWNQKLNRKKWALALGSTMCILILLSKIQSMFPHQTISYIPEIALLISVSLAAWGWLLIQHMLLEKNYNLLLVNGLGLFGAGVLSGFHIIITWFIKTMPILFPFVLIALCSSLCQSYQLSKEKHTILFRVIFCVLFICSISFLFAWLTNSLPDAYYNSIEPTPWQPNEHDHLFAWVSLLMPISISYWIALLLYIGWLVFACHLIGYTLYSYLLKNYSATLLAFAGSTIPLIASMMGYIVLDESLPKGFIQSFIGISISLLLFYMQEQKEG